MPGPFKGILILRPSPRQRSPGHTHSVRWSVCSVVKRLTWPASKTTLMSVKYLCCPVLCLDLSCPVLCLDLSCPVLCLDLSCPVLCLDLSCPVLCCPVLCLDLSCPDLSCLNLVHWQSVRDLQ
ncbi:unnamed protein product [Arctogadus glacialis]